MQHADADERGQRQQSAAAAPMGPLAGLRVVEASTTLPGAFAGQFLADAGAEVLLVEQPGGGPLRARPGWPAIARGKRSVVLDLHQAADRQALEELLATADVFLHTFRPRTAARWELGGAELVRRHPRLVSAAITGWGSTGPWADLKGYEGMVMAKLGAFETKQRATPRPGPAFVSVPYASWGAAHTAVHGILAALYERESSGAGQHVEADLVRGFATLDTWTWFEKLIGQRWPGAYELVDAYDPAGNPNSPLVYGLLLAPTKDGVWLQFSQVEPRLLAALVEELGLTPLLAEPKWKGFPLLPQAQLRTEFWELMLQRVGERTLAEWQRVFETNPNIAAEVFRSGPQVLDHPQLLHDGRVVTVADPQHGPVRQPSTLVHVDGAPLTEVRPAPAVDDAAAVVRSARSAAAERPQPTPAAPEPRPAPAGTLPLAGVTVVEFGVMYAAPYGATLLTDLGARVVKVESPAGDSIRRVLPFPEAGGAKVMQGKESVVVDLGTEEGRRIVHELVRRADAVLQGFRAGAAARAGVDAETLRAINPDLVYLAAPGYGTDGPYARRPAYAPAVGAAAGLGLADAPGAACATSSLAQVRTAAVQLNTAVAVPTMQADGIAALGVASALLLGLLARRRGRAMGTMTATMLATATHAMIEHVTDYPGRPALPTPDGDLHGYHALYRLYRAVGDGWVFLAAPAASDWAALTAVLPGGDRLAADPRFADPGRRAAHDEELAAELAAIFATNPAESWEKQLTAVDVGCVAVGRQAPELVLQSDAALAAGYCATTHSPVFEEHRRLAPVVRFSRSGTRSPGGCLAGQHTDAVLGELGYDEATIADLRERKIVG